jgi:hypothetical protein
VSSARFWVREAIWKEVNVAPVKPICLCSSKRVLKYRWNLVSPHPSPTEWHSVGKQPDDGIIELAGVNRGSEAPEQLSDWRSSAEAQY